MTNPVYESMTRFETSHFLVRVWRDEGSLARALKPDVRDIEETIPTCCSNMESILTTIGAMDRVAAVEVLNRGSLDGVVFYPNWT